ncbi:MAG: hypothetical protein WBP12_01120 [Candidatus Saccharimonas sp.]
MKNILGFFIELSVTFVVALALSILFAVVSLFVMGNFDGPLTESNTQWVHAGSGAVMGLIIGYKLNTLIRTHTKSIVKKKSKK